MKKNIDVKLNGVKIDINEAFVKGYSIINDLRKGEFFLLKEGTAKESNVWVYDGWNSSTRKYEAHKWNDVNHFRQFKKNTLVYTMFEF